jgi:hypothetical protein
MGIAFIGYTIFSWASLLWGLCTRLLSLNNYVESLSFVYAKIKDEVLFTLGDTHETLDLSGAHHYHFYFNRTHHLESKRTK